MTVITVSDNVPIRNWETDSTNADLVVDGVTLRGTAAAGYLFGQALGTIKYQGLLDGVQLTDGTFEFPPGSGQWVSLPEVADALQYKYGVDPLIEFAPGLGLRGYSVADINAILERLNQEFGDQFRLPPIDSAAVKSATQAAFDAEKTAASSGATYDTTAAAILLDGASIPMLAGATEAELRENLTVGGELYVDRHGAFFINGVPTSAKDVAVVSRLLAQDNISAEYKVLMDEYTERNNLIEAARTVIGGGLSGVTRTTDSLSQTYGYDDVLSELTSGQYSDDTFFYWKTDLDNDAVTFDIDPAWVSGTRVRIDRNTGGETAGTRLEAETDYYVRSLGNGAYSFFLSQADATGTGTNNRANLTGLVDRTALVQVQGWAPMAPTGNVIDVNLIPGTVPGNTLQTYDPMQYATISFGPDGAKDDYLQFFPIAPGWPEDTQLEFSQSWGGVTAGQVNYVANWFPQVNGQNRVQLTPNADGINGGANDNSNRATAQPAGTVMLYDTDSAATETWTGYTQFSLPGTNFATGTAFTPNEDVDILMTHTNSSETLYKSVVSMRKGTTYYLRNDGDGKYSAYTSKTYADNADGRGKLFFAIDERTDYAGSATKPPFITNQTATVWGISRGITILGATSAGSGISTANLPRSEMTFQVDPLWANGTAVQTGATGGGLTAGVTYYTRKETNGQYFFYTTEAAALNGGSTGLVPVYAPLPSNMFRLSDQDLELSSLSSDWNEVTALLNTLISNKVRDGDLDQAKLQTLTAQLQNNTEAMTAMLKVFSDLNATLAQALR